MFRFKGLRQVGARRMRRLAGNDSGMAAIEFAMIVPIMVMLFFGSVEFSQALTVDRRVAQIASSTADLVAQYDNITQTQVSNIFVTTNSLMQPYPTGTVKISVTNLERVDTNTPTGTWSQVHNGATNYKGSYSQSVPTGLIDNPGGTGTSCVVMSEVQYNFTPIVAYFLTSSISLSEKFYMKPRKSTCVVCTDCP